MDVEQSMTKLEQHRRTWPDKSDEWLFERLALELRQKVEEIHKLLEENESLSATMQWVSVTERLPEINQQVLVLGTNPNIVTTGYIHKYGHWIWSSLNGSTHKADHIYKITHWMPLPEPPSI